VQLSTEWRSQEDVPDLDHLPTLASTTGIDLNPLDPRREGDRRWLEALVWPEDRGKARQLQDALGLAVRTPVDTCTGDAIQLAPRWSARLPAGQPRIVFHCATRMHVPVDQLGHFDGAISNIGNDGPVYHIEIEGDGLVIAGPDATILRTYDVDGHLAWVRPR